MSCEAEWEELLDGNVDGPASAAIARNHGMESTRAVSIAKPAKPLTTTHRLAKRIEIYCVSALYLKSYSEGVGCYDKFSRATDFVTSKEQ